MIIPQPDKKRDPASPDYMAIQWYYLPYSNEPSLSPSLIGSDHMCQNTRSAEPQKEPISKPVMPTAAPVAPVPLVVAPPVNETTIWQVSVRPDSPEIGTPGKNGALKIYMDFSDAADSEARIRTAVAMRSWLTNS